MYQKIQTKNYFHSQILSLKYFFWKTNEKFGQKLKKKKKTELLVLEDIHLPSLSTLSLQKFQYLFILLLLIFYFTYFYITDLYRIVRPLTLTIEKLWPHIFTCRFGMEWELDKYSIRLTHSTKIKLYYCSFVLIYSFKLTLILCLIW